jgi:hypothetical protein
MKKKVDRVGRRRQNRKLERDGLLSIEGMKDGKTLCGFDPREVHRMQGL